jgi:hypothetical protein
VDDQRPLHGQPGGPVREARRHLGEPRALARATFGSGDKGARPRD